MTSKQYYKQTSDMAYPLNDFGKDNKNPNKVIANIALIHGGTRNDALKILDDNDFFSLPSDFDFRGIDTNEIELEIRFHYGIDDIDCFKVNVCDIIDCTVVDGGKIVLSCEGYKLVKSICPPPCPVNNSSKDEKKETTAVSTNRKSIFDLFDDIVGCSSRFDDLFNFPAFPKFPDITKMIEETRKNIESNVESSKGDGNTKFYNFSCKIDPDGKVHIKRSSNDGTVEKEFKLGDSSSSSYYSNTEPRKMVIDDDNDPKTELKNLIK